MAAILIAGPESDFRDDLRRALLDAGYRVTGADDRGAALQLLGAMAEHLVVIVATLPEGEAEELLGAVATDDRLQTGRTFLLVAAEPMYLPASMTRRCAELGIPVVARPLDDRDRDAWGDLLDAVRLAMRHFPDEQPDAASD